MDNFEKELTNLTANERAVVIDKLKDELSYEKNQIVRDVITQRANNVPYATIIHTALEKYIGKSVQELAEMFDLNVQSKSINRNIISSILDIEGLNDGYDNFSKETIKIKSVTLNENNKFNNGMSLNPFSFEDIVNEEWDTSELRLTFKKNIFLFVIFKEESPSNIVLTKCLGWTIDNDILDNNIKEVWEIVQMNLKIGKVISFIDINKRMKTTFPSTTFNGVCFVAAHAHSKKDTAQLPVADKLTGITDLTKHSFWITKDYLYDILGITNDISLKNKSNDDVSVPFDDDISVPLDDDISVPLDDDISVPLDDDISVPLDDDISVPLDDDISVPLYDDVRVPLDDDIRVPIGFDTTEDSVIVEEDTNIVDNNHIFDEIDISFDEVLGSLQNNSNQESIDDLLAALMKKPKKNKNQDIIIEDQFDIAIDDIVEDENINDVDIDDEVHFEELTSSNESTMNDFKISQHIDANPEIVDSIEFSEHKEKTKITESVEEIDFSDTLEIPKISERTVPEKRVITESNDPIIDRFSGSESVDTLTARLESNLRKLEAEYSSGLGTLSASGKYSLRGRIEKRIAKEMDGDFLNYEHLETVDHTVKKKRDKQLKKAEKKQRKNK